MNELSTLMPNTRGPVFARYCLKEDRLYVVPK